MTNNDPAVVQAADMWKQGQKREAMHVLVQRVNNLNQLNSEMNEQILRLERRARGNHYQPKVKPTPASLPYRDVLIIFANNDWKTVVRTSRTAQLQKRVGVSWIPGAAAVLLLGLVGWLIVLLGRAFSSAVSVTIELDDEQVTHMLYDQYDFIASEPSDVEHVAKSVKGGIPTLAAFVLSLLNYPIVLYIIAII